MYVHNNLPTVIDDGCIHATIAVVVFVMDSDGDPYVSQLPFSYNLLP